MKKHENRLIFAILCVAGLVLLTASIAATSWRLFGFAMLWCGGLVLAWNWHGTSAPSLRRMQRRSARHAGMASWPQTARYAGGLTYRRKVAVLAPHTQPLRTWQRHNPRQVPLNSLARPVGYIGRWPLRMRIRAAVEGVILMVGGPRGGKSGTMATLIAAAVGPVLVTTTRLDLYRLTAPIRSKVGPIAVFNPSAPVAVANGEPPPLPTTVIFDPLTGCGEPGAAIDRASDLISGAQEPGQRASTEREFWLEQATLALASLLHAAALHAPNYTMRDVAAWVGNPDDAGIVHQLLQASPEPGTRVAARQFLDMNPRTRDGITATIRPALTWLLHPPAAAAAGLPPAGGTFVTDDDGRVIPSQPAGNVLDVATFIASNGTLYLLGAHDVKTAPLVAAFTAEVARQARRVALTLADERLDPALLLALDEAALICPIPLHRWTADMGGRNISIAIAVQSKAQLVDRYGDEGAATIINNAEVIVLFGGGKDSDDGAFWSKLIGEYPVMSPHYDEHGRYQGEREDMRPVLPAAALAQLPAGRIVVIPRAGRPILARADLAWHRHDVRRSLRLDRRPDAQRNRAAVPAGDTGSNSTAANPAADPAARWAGASSPPPPPQGDQDPLPNSAPSGGKAS